MGRSSAAAINWRGRLFEPYDPANPQPRLPRAEAKDYEPSPWVEGGQVRHPEAKEPSDGESGASCALRSLKDTGATYT